MSQYTNQNAISGYISAQNLIALTDDNGTGSIDLGVLSAVMTSVSATIDGLLSPIYTVPFSPIPALVAEAATQMACKTLMGRRLVPGEVNPFKTAAESLWSALERIAQNRGGLDANTRAAFVPGHVEVFCSLVNSSTA